MKDKEIDMIDNEVTGLIYEEPKCDFEHIWNCAISSASDSINSWKKDDEIIALNEDKLKPSFEIRGGEND